MKREHVVALGLLALLVALGVVGRWWQPAWNFTPTAAVALLAGYALAGRVAWLAPVAVLAISNLILPAYQSPGVMVAVYGSMLVPVFLGRWLRRRPSGTRVLAATFLPALVFYLTTNFAHWLLIGYYPHTPAGLIQCYWQAVPFLRWMLLGDMLYIPCLIAAYELVATRGAVLAAWRLWPAVRKFREGAVQQPDVLPNSAA